jgi:hypothetical protein
MRLGMRLSKILDMVSGQGTSWLHDGTASRVCWQKNLTAHEVGGFEEI